MFREDVSAATETGFEVRASLRLSPGPGPGPGQFERNATRPNVSS